MTFIYFLISVVVFYYIFKIGMRLLMPFFMKKMAEKIVWGVHKVNLGIKEQTNKIIMILFRSSNNNSIALMEKVRVEYTPPKQENKRKGTETAGEFIDFEEVK
ncbi:hypothetical protein [Sphingobacterium daejeonense]|uniref:hypothetical protein n=1 Tax=Sphingobacterium daejeonense TaxID=371142 RepID=UPI0010C3A182|nr:hypothetical protein [Sphingobacterium daejeonense]VTP89724.1 Uncharacterised protein [Sphingobacterium daejeonense]